MEESRRKSDADDTATNALEDNEAAPRLSEHKFGMVFERRPALSGLGDGFVGGRASPVGDVRTDAEVVADVEDDRDSDSSSSGDFEDLRDRIAERTALMRHRVHDDSTLDRVALGAMTTSTRRRRRDDAVLASGAEEERGMLNPEDAEDDERARKRKASVRDVSQYRYLVGLAVACLLASFSTPSTVQPATELGTTDARKYDPWDQGEMFRDRGTRPKTNKKKKISSKKTDDREVDNGRGIHSELPWGDLPRESLVSGNVTSSDTRHQREHDLIKSLANFSPWWIPFNVETDLPVYFDILSDNGSSVVTMRDKCYAQSNPSNSKLHSNTSTLALDMVANVTVVPNVLMQHISQSAPHPEIFAVTSLYNVNVTLLSLTNSRRGRCFVIISKPREGDPYEMQSQSLQPSKATNDTSLFSDDSMVRTMTDTASGELSQHHLDLAMTILGRKCLVGLAERREESILRFEKFFGWTKATRRTQCAGWYVVSAKGRYSARRNATSGSVRNHWDKGLYEYTLELFRSQGEWLSNYSINYDSDHTESGVKRYSNVTAPHTPPIYGQDTASPPHAPNQAILDAPNSSHVTWEELNQG